MKKLTNKLMLSILAIAFALITLGTTTFAWFTIGGTAELRGIRVQITTGSGIEISLSANGVTNPTNEWKNVWNATEVEDYIYDDLEYPTGFVLNHITSTNGMDFFGMDVTSNIVSNGTNANATNTVTGARGAQYLAIPVYFRTQAPNTTVFLNSTSTSSAPTRNWIADVPGWDTTPLTALVEQQDLSPAAPIVPIKSSWDDLGNSVEVDPTTATRVSFVKSDPANWGIWSVTTTGTPKLTWAKENIGTDGTTVQGNAAMVYGVKKGVYTGYHVPYNQGASMDTYGGANWVPSTGGGKLDSGSTPTAWDPTTLNTEIIKGNVFPLGHASAADPQPMDWYQSGTYYYCRVVINIWIEGWDSECFNWLLGTDLTINLSFGTTL